MIQNKAFLLSLDFINDKSVGWIYNWTYQRIDGLDLSENFTHTITAIVLLVFISGLLCGVDYLLRRVFLSIVKIYVQKSKTKLDDMLLNNKVFDYLCHIAIVILSKVLLSVVFSRFPNLLNFVNKLTGIILVITITIFVRCIFKGLRDFARTKKSLADKPLDSYYQVVSILLYFVAAIGILSVITRKEPWPYLVSLGAASAILLLVFKDTIMGFVASIQVSSNDMVRIGDWIEMKKFDADGTVIEINLNTVKVQNFDKTITMIPSYMLISDSFKNYRGMHSSGGRRIKRHINIKVSSIRFLEPEEIEELKKIQLLVPYIEQRTAEIEKYNEDTNADQSMPVNGRRITNIGMFRAYILSYTEQNPNIHKGYYLMVRQLQPNEYGLPLELYMFTNNTEWTVYESIMADIFDHLLSSIKFFNLEVFELPASDDLRSLKNVL